ncbi:MULTISPECIES: hypothetical protein [Methylobacterium]|nr:MULTISPECIES: hypothetical protein [Methylobacterium]GBU16515.1 hypothetical protein AwMethylo_07300 [Methylobacterium sp.]
MATRHWVLGTLAAIIALASLGTLIPPEGGSGSNGRSAAGNEPTGKPTAGSVEPVSPWAYIMPAPYDAQPKLAYDFGLRLDMSDAILTASGYPLILTVAEMPACATPWLAKEAIDAFKQQDRRWVDSTKDCLVIPAGTYGEWLKPFVPPEAGRFRFALRDGSRLTLYGPANTLSSLQGTFALPSLSAARKEAMGGAPEPEKRAP